MLKHTLIHPEISEVLARAGHHGKVLLADGNYPASTKKGPNARVVSLNLSPGVITVSQALRAVLSAPLCAPLDDAALARLDRDALARAAPLCPPSPAW